MTSRTLTIPSTGDLRALSDTDLMQRLRDFTAARRVVDAGQAEIAGELARRSARDLGYDGLAVRVGARTVEKLVSNLTGVSGAEARSMVTVGTADEWARPIVEGVTSGAVGVGTAAAIQTGLGEPSADISAEKLSEAARRLAAEAPTLSPEQASRRARQVRDELDADGVVDREKALREKRYLRLSPRADGMTRVDGLLDPESAALITDAFDRTTMPRRGGPRFIDSRERAREEAATDDDRSIEQLMVDSLVQIVTTAAGADDGTVFGTKSPAVRVHVRAADLVAGTGAGYAEGQSAGLSIGTVHRLICRDGTIPILFDDDGTAMNVGREIRPFTPRQRIAIAARDGGCMNVGCDRPPSWTEAHHCDEWGRGGGTDIGNGISLCRHCHMWLHNTGRWITSVEGEFRLHTPGEAGYVVLRSKHPLQQVHARVA